jgi:hypothetical protein
MIMAIHCRFCLVAYVQRVNVFVHPTESTSLEIVGVLGMALANERWHFRVLGVVMSGYLCRSAVDLFAALYRANKSHQHLARGVVPHKVRGLLSADTTLLYSGLPTIHILPVHPFIDALPLPRIFPLPALGQGQRYNVVKVRSIPPCLARLSIPSGFR